MKICAVICEYNPFHNGHAYQLREMRARSGCDKLLCIMSGNFTQRGEPAVFGKYERARHAILGGADAVLELPTAFSVAPAEIFARGAVHILASIPAVEVLAFGCESGVAEDFLTAAKATLREDKQFRAALRERMKDGTSYPKARTDVLLALHEELDGALFTSPNNLLGVEYCRSLLLEGAAIRPLPIPRVGSGYGDPAPAKNFSSATALRELMKKGDRRARSLLKKNVPSFVFEAASSYMPIPYEVPVLCSLLQADAARIAATPDCSEGLENRLLAMARTNPRLEDMLEKVVSKRYTRSRIRRILLENFLGLGQREVAGFLTAPLYCRTLAVRREGAEELLSALSLAPLVTRKSDYALLKKEALACFAIDMRANTLYNALTGNHSGDYETLFV